MQKFNKVIVVTGTPGVGKTLFSNLLASKLNALHINIGELVKQEKLWNSIDQTRGTLIADTQKLSKRIQDIIKHSQQDIILDGHYATDLIPAKNIHRVFVLRREPKELRQSMLKKGFIGKKLKENLAAEILDVCLHNAVKNCGMEKVCEIDTTGKKPEEAVKEALAILKGKKPCTIGIVDWLGKLEKENQLEEFLEDF